MEIEEHIAKCMTALDERKAALMKEVAQKVTNQSMIHTSLTHLPSSLFSYLYISLISVY